MSDAPLPPARAAPVPDPSSPPAATATDLRRAELGLLTTVTFWAVNFSVAKYALGIFDPLAFNALRFPLASALLWAALRRRGPLRRPKRSDLLNIVGLGLLGNVAYQGLFILGLDLTLAGNASLLLASSPVWTAILARLLQGERQPLRVWVGIGATLAGMALVVLGGGAGVGAGATTLAGDLLMVAAAVAWALFTVVSARPIARYGSLSITAWTLWTGTPVLVLLGLPELARQDWSVVGSGGWLAVAFSGVASIGLAYLFWHNGVRVLGGTRTAAYSNLVPVLALLVAWAWLGEAAGALQLVGAGVIILGVTLARRRARAAGPAAR